MGGEPARRTLDQRALAYVLDQFDETRVLDAALKALVGSAAGELFTYLPADIDEEQAYRFGSGGILPARPERYPAEGGYLVPVDSLVPVRDELFAQILRSDPRACCIVSEVNPSPDDPDPPSEPTVFWVGEECYHWLDGRSSDDLVEETFSLAEVPWHSVAACCLPASPITQNEMDQAALVALARDVTHVSVRAYDGEGFVIWKRT